MQADKIVCSGGDKRGSSCMRYGSLLCIVALTGTPATAAERRAVWEPAGQWTLEASPNKCTAVRTFTKDRRSFRMALNPTPAGEGGELILLMPKAIPALESADVFIGGVRTKGRGALLDGINKRAEWIYGIGLAAEDYARMLQSGTVEIATRSIRITASLGELQQANFAVARCNVDLLKRLGFPDATDLSTSANSVRPFNEYTTADDYPDDAIRNSANGMTKLLVAVGADGLPEECRVLRSAGSDALDQQGCNILIDRARYTPARNKVGQTVKAPIFVNIRWMLRTW